MGTEKTFTDIMRCYRMQPQSASHVYRNVMLSSPEERGDLIKFYNTIFIGRMQKYALRFSNKSVSFYWNSSKILFQFFLQVLWSFRMITTCHCHPCPIWGQLRCLPVGRCQTSIQYSSDPFVEWRRLHLQSSFSTNSAEVPTIRSRQLMQWSKWQIQSKF